MKNGQIKASEAFKGQYSSSDIKRHIRWLRSLSLRCTDFEYLRSQVMPLLHGYLMLSPQVDVGECIYRAVSWKEKPKTKDDLSYPPRSIVNSFGRANRPDEPLFYGSAASHSTILELDPKLGERLAISKWRVKTPIYLAPAGYSERYFKGKAGMGRWGEISWAKQYAADPLAQKSENQIVHDFLAREFTKKVPNDQAWQYKLTAAFTSLVMNAHAFGMNGAPAIKVGGVLYPSIPNEVNVDNVALKPDIADNCLEFVSVQYVEISKKTAQNAYTMSGIDYAENLSKIGDIQWTNKFPTHLVAGTDHSLHIENGNMVIRNNSGIVVGQL